MPKLAVGTQNGSDIELYYEDHGSGRPVIHGDADAIVPLEVSGKRAHEWISGSELVVVEGAPHGLNVSHAEPFNRALLDFLG